MDKYAQYHLEEVNRNLEKSAKSLLSQYRNELIGGLAGATVGGTATGLATGRREDESDEDFNRRRLQNVLMGAISGGAIGGLGLPRVAKTIDSLAKSEKPSVLSSIARAVNPMVNPAAGAVEGAAGGYVAGTVWGKNKPSEIIKQKMDAQEKAIKYLKDDVSRGRVGDGFGNLVSPGQAKLDAAKAKWFQLKELLDRIPGELYAPTSKGRNLRRLLKAEGALPARAKWLALLGALAVPAATHAVPAVMARGE